MKKIILLLLLITSVFIKAQNNTTDLPGRWRLGFNMGGIWESSDVKPIPGLGGGFTLEKILNKRSDAFLGFSLGFRYLGGRTYGVNGSPTFDLANNKALNGTYNSAIRYDTTPGYFYANHKTFIQEGALELKMNFPGLEKKTGIIFHLWGGIGIGKYKTWIDALDKDGKMYDFSSLKGQPVTQSDLSRIYDHDYETLAQGSDANGTIKFMPSLGVGLGYKLSRGVALVFEHKVTFPGTNWLDGIAYPKNCPVTGANDFYNYTSLGIVFTFYGGHHSAQTNSSANNTVNSNTTATNTQTTNNGYTAPVVYPPKVVITYPANNFNSLYDYTTINASLQNVSSSQQISISQNGYAIHHFTYNAFNGTLHFQTFLAAGSNNFVVVASNAGGTASQGVTINYNPLNTSGYSVTGSTVTPINSNTVAVNTNTVSTTFTTSVGGHTVTPTQTVSPTYTTVTSATVAPTVTVSTTHTSTTVTSETVSPTVTVSPTHTTTTVSSGTVSPTMTISTTSSVTPTLTTTTSETVSTMGNSGHVTPIPVVFKPVVSFMDPGNYSTETTAASFNIIGSVMYVTAGNQITVTVNGVNINSFTFNAATKVVNFLAMLQLGYNTITITGTNSAGSDTKSVIINHKQEGRPPKVYISNPSSSPFTSLQNNVIVSGYVYNVVSSADINVTANGAPTTFNYNISNHEISVSLFLTANSTQVNIAASNAFGNDAQSIELIYNKVDDTNGNGATIGGGVATNTTSTGNSSSSGMGGLHGNHSKPEISVLSPVVDPFYTNTGVVSVSANVNFVLNASDVTVTYNGLQVSITYDVNSKHLNFSSPLKPGLNSFVIAATNTWGTANKSININYSPIVVNTTDGGNNNTGPIINHGVWHIGGNTVPESGDGQAPPKKVIDNGDGRTNPVKPVINPGTIQSAPKVNSDNSEPIKPAENGGQIRLRPR
jgi:hypothetical protein